MNFMNLMNFMNFMNFMICYFSAVFHIVNSLMNFMNFMNSMNFMNFMNSMLRLTEIIKFISSYPQGTHPRIDRRYSFSFVGLLSFEAKQTLSQTAVGLWIQVQKDGKLNVFSLLGMAFRLPCLLHASLFAPLHSQLRLATLGL